MFGYKESGKKGKIMNDEFSQQGVAGEVVTISAVSDKSKLVAALLCFFLGWLGMHRIYLGHVGTGIVLILLNVLGFLTLGIIVGFFLLCVAVLWEIIDFIRILLGSLKDKEGRTLK